MIIENHKWSNMILDFPDTKLKRKVMATPINQFLDKDEIVWTPTLSGRFSSKSTYNSHCKLGNRVRWHGVVWGRWVQ